MLSDKHIVSLPSAVWKPILHCFVLPFRPEKTAKAYRHIWTPQGSPYHLYSRSVERSLKRMAAEACGTATNGGEPPLVRMAQRYAEPSVESALRLYSDHEVAGLTVLPLYPQEARATTGSVRDELERSLAALSYRPRVRFISDYHDHPLYISALAESINRHVGSDASPEQARLVFSYHSTPTSDLKAGDPYRQQTQATAALAAAAAGLPDALWTVAYQSRFNDARRWIGPYLTEELQRLLGEGVREFYVIAPGFAVDNIETLYEIEYEAAQTLAERASEMGIPKGDVRLQYIPALNDNASHLRLLAALTLPES